MLALVMPMSDLSLRRVFRAAGISATSVNLLACGEWPIVLVLEKRLSRSTCKMLGSATFRGTEGASVPITHPLHHYTHYTCYSCSFPFTRNDAEPMLQIELLARTRRECVAHPWQVSSRGTCGTG